MPKKKTGSRFTTVRILKATNEKIQKAKEESKYILSSDNIISKAMDFYLKRKKIRWE